MSEITQYIPTKHKKREYTEKQQSFLDNLVKAGGDAKIAAEKLQEVATMVDMRFGHGTWKGILAERQKRIQEAKEAALKAKREAIRRRNEVMEQVKIAVVITAVVVVGLMFLMFAVFSPF